jgi:hypothetical protein
LRGWVALGSEPKGLCEVVTCGAEAFMVVIVVVVWVWGPRGLGSRIAHLI